MWSGYFVMGGKSPSLPIFRGRNLGMRRSVRQEYHKLVSVEYCNKITGKKAFSN